MHKKKEKVNRPIQQKRMSAAYHTESEEENENKGLSIMPPPFQSKSLKGGEKEEEKPQSNEKSKEPPSTKFYNKIGEAIIRAAKSEDIDISQAIYLIAQARLESGYRLNPPGNNIFNITGVNQQTGAAVKQNAKEYNKAGQVYYLNRDYRAYDTLDESISDQVSLLNRLYPESYNALTNPSSSIDAYSDGLLNGKLGAFATDPKYKAKMESTYNSVFNYYFETFKAEIPDNNAKIDDYNSKISRFLQVASGLDRNGNKELSSKFADLAGKWMYKKEKLVARNEEIKLLLVNLEKAKAVSNEKKSKAANEKKVK